MKDFPFWHNALKATKTQLALNPRVNLLGVNFYGRLNQAA
jgi:hypothetical protein